MKVRFAILMVLLICGSVFADPPIKGVVLTMVSEDPDIDYSPFLREIADLGADHVSLLIPYYQDGAEAVRIYQKTGKTPALGQVKETAISARELELEVMLLPIVLLEDDTGDDWRGSLRPANVDEWFSSYARIIEDIAILANETDAAIISIGSEFTSLQQHEDHWRRICGKARSHFDGEIVYTCNWDIPDEMPWWDAVDYMAISGYFELAMPDENEATTASLTLEWEQWKAWLTAIRDDAAPDKRILFCEIGYPSIDGGAALPWDYTRDAPIDLEEQRRGFEAFIRTWDGDPDFAGCFVYTWIDFDGDPMRGYSPRGKPAEELLGAWWMR